MGNRRLAASTGLAWDHLSRLVELAKKAKLTQGYVTMIETGAGKSPSLPVLKRLAKSLGVPVTALLE